MKSVLFLVGGIMAAAAGYMLMGQRRVREVENLAHKLEEAWADHHTVA